MRVIWHDIKPEHHDCALNATRAMIANQWKSCGFRYTVRCDETLWLVGYRSRKGTIIIRYSN